LHPRKETDRGLLRELFGIARWTYNEAVRIIGDASHQARREALGITWHSYLRKELVDMDSPAVLNHIWLAKLAYDVRDKAAKEAADAHKIGMKKLAAGDIQRFHLRFRSKKHMHSESLWLRSDKKKDRTYVEVSGSEKQKARLRRATNWKSGKLEQLVDKSDRKAVSRIESRYKEKRLRAVATKNAASDVWILWPNLRPMNLWCPNNDAARLEDGELGCARLQHTKAGDYFLCVSKMHEGPGSQKAFESQDRLEAAPDSPLRVCSLDPGVRIFQTLYDPSGKLVEIGGGDATKITHACLQLDRLQSEASAAQTSKKRRALRKKMDHLRRRIRNRVDELHKQTANAMARSYDLIMIPVMGVQRMVNRTARRISSKTVRQMLCWGHYRFRQRLLHKCRQHGSKVAIVSEAHTTMTCGRCGRMRADVGGSEVFHCQHCGLRIGRDANGARNIFIRNANALGLVPGQMGPTPLRRNPERTEPWMFRRPNLRIMRRIDMTE